MRRLAHVCFVDRRARCGGVAGRRSPAAGLGPGADRQTPPPRRRRRPAPRDRRRAERQALPCERAHRAACARPCHARRPGTSSRVDARPSASTSPRSRRHLGLLGRPARHRVSRLTCGTWYFSNWHQEYLRMVTPEAGRRAALYPTGMLSAVPAHAGARAARSRTRCEARAEAQGEGGSAGGARGVLPRSIPKRALPDAVGAAETPPRP